MLEIRKIVAGYTKENMILKGIDLHIDDNEIVAVVGQNGSGKSTLAKSIMNIVPFIEGEILFDGQSIYKKNTAEIKKYGLGFFMQGGKIFPNLTVNENIVFASGNMNKEEVDLRIEKIKRYFELLRNKQRKKIKASFLSGGEQHQLALAMVLMLKPKFLILDEPSAGLSPANINNLYESLKLINQNEVKSIIIIEQNIASAVKFSDRIVLLQEGKITKEERCEKLKSVSQIESFLDIFYRESKL